MIKKIAHKEFSTAILGAASMDEVPSGDPTPDQSVLREEEKNWATHAFRRLFNPKDRSDRFYYLMICDFFLEGEGSVGVAESDDSSDNLRLHARRGYFTDRARLLAVTPNTIRNWVTESLEQLRSRALQNISGSQPAPRVNGPSRA